MGKFEMPLVEQNNHKLFKLMKKALAKAKTLKKEVIYLTGEIRSGKSTTFNWISNPGILVGGDNRIDPIYHINTRHTDQNAYAKIKNSFQSVTLIPNVKTIRKGEISLADLPGNKDRRSEVQVMMVSFILNACFKYTERARFIIVISDNGFKATDGTQFINAINSFARLFCSTSISDQQLDCIFSSASILITAVPIAAGKQAQTKKYYCRRLKQYIPKLQELQATYKDLNSIYPLVIKLIQNILSKERLQLFPRAIFGQSARQATVLQSLESCGWSAVDLRCFYDHLIFPYELHFKELQEYQQQALLEMIRQKMYQYDRLARILGSFIQSFMQNPLSFDESTFQSDFKELQRLLQQINPQEQQWQQMQQNHSYINISSIFIVKSLLKLNRFTYEITFDQDRDEESKKKQDYFGYLRSYYVQTLQTLRQCFAAAGKNRRSFDRAISIFEEGFEYFTFICNVEKSILSQAHQRIKQATCVMNVPNFNDFDIKKTYFTKLRQEEMSEQQFELQEISEMLEFIEGEKAEEYETGLIYHVLYKCYQIAAQKYKQERNYQIALEYLLYSLLNTIKLDCVYNYSLELQQGDSQNLSTQIISLTAVQEILYKDIKKIIYEVDTPNQPQFLEAYCRFCDSNNYIQDTIFVISKILNNRQIKNNPLFRERLRQYKERKLQLQSQRQAQRNQQNLSRVQQQTKYLSIINFLSTMFFNINEEIKYEEIQQNIKQMYQANMQSQQLKNQFNVELPPNLTNYQILAYSRYLISKIKKRKTIVLLGKKAGKSTSCYWLRGKELFVRGSCICLPSNSKEPNKIIQSLLNHTEVPNIYNVSEDELLVDCPHIYLKDPEKMIIAGLITKQIIENSSACKFILVIKESDVLQNEGKELLSMILQYISMWNIWKVENCKEVSQKVIKGLRILVTFKKADKNIAYVRQSLKELEKLFQKKENLQIIQDQYKLKIDGETQLQIHAVINHILFKKLFSYLDLKDIRYKKKTKMIETLSDNWDYITIPSQTDHLLKQEQIFPFHHLEQPQINQFLSQVQDNVNAIIDIGRTVETIIVRSFFQFYSLHKISTQNQQLEQKLSNLIGPKMLQSELVKNKQKKAVLYPNLSDIKLSQNSIIKQLAIQQTLNKLIQLTWKLSCCLCESHSQPFFNLCQESLDLAVNLLANNKTTINLYEACRLKVYELFQLWKLHQIAAQGSYNYQIMGNRILMVQAYQFANDIDWNLARSLCIKILNLETLRSQPNKQQILSQLFTFFDNIDNMINLQLNHLVQSRKIDQVVLFFLQYCPDDGQCLRVLLKQAQTAIALASNYPEKELEWKMMSIMDKIIVRMASENFKAAYQLATRYGNNKTTTKMFQRRLEVAEADDKRATLVKYLEWSIDVGERANEIMEMLNRYQSLLENEQIQSFKQKIVKRARQSKLVKYEQQTRTLEQLKKYIQQVYYML